MQIAGITAAASSAAMVAQPDLARFGTAHLASCAQSLQHMASGRCVVAQAGLP
jgi:hypothetical protein